MESFCLAFFCFTQLPFSLEHRLSSQYLLLYWFLLITTKFNNHCLRFDTTLCVLDSNAIANVVFGVIFVSLLFLVLLFIGGVIIYIAIDIDIGIGIVVVAIAIGIDIAIGIAIGIGIVVVAIGIVIDIDIVIVTYV